MLRIAAVSLLFVVVGLSPLQLDGAQAQDGLQHREERHHPEHHVLGQPAPSAEGEGDGRRGQVEGDHEPAIGARGGAQLRRGVVERPCRALRVVVESRCAEEVREGLPRVPADQVLPELLPQVPHATRITAVDGRVGVFRRGADSDSVVADFPDNRPALPS